MDIYEQCAKEAKKVNKRKVDSVLEQLPKKDAESLKKALLDENVPTRSIQRVLMQNSINCGNWAINQWRRDNQVTTFTTTTPRKSK